jgi:hypothetical protein
MGAGSCVITSSAAGMASKLDGSLLVTLDLDLGPQASSREVTQGTGTTSLVTDQHFICAGMDVPSSGAQEWSWMEIPQGRVVSADGTTIEGSYTESAGAAGMQTSSWKLTALREP